MYHYVISNNLIFGTGNIMNKARKLSHRKFVLKNILWYCRNIIPLAYDEEWKQYYHGINEKKEFLSLFETKLSSFEKAYSSKIIEKLEKFIDDVVTEKKDANENLEKFIFDQLEKIDDELKLIPRSLEKTKNALLGLVDTRDFDLDQGYEILCIFKSEISQDYINEIEKEWNKQYKESYIKWLEREKPEIRRILKFSHRFWTSRDFMESIDDVSRYRFIKTFKLDEFSSTIEAIELDFRQEMDGFNLWLISRIPSLCEKVRSYIETSLDSIIDSKYEEQYWSSKTYDEKQKSFVPSIHETVFNVFAILRYSRNPKQIEIAQSCIEWIWLNQDPEGFWEHDFLKEKTKKEASVFNTLIAIQVLNLVDKEKYRLAINKGEEWIIGQQDFDGFWEEKHAGNFVFLSASILDYFVGRPFFYTEDNGISKTSIIELLSEGKTKEAIDSSLILTSANFPNEYKDIVLLSSQFHELERRRMLGLQWESHEFAKITHGLIEVISRLQ